ncbi:MAG: type IV toxin-antitoxin system AbiEi family antitoxin [Pseudomonadota bacterium]
MLGLTEQGRRELTRREAMEQFALGESTVNEVLSSLVRKGWLARAGRGKYLLIPPEWGATPVGESNTLALASQLTTDGYIGFSTAAAHWGLTTQIRNVVWIVTRTHARARRINDSDIRFARLPAKALFGFERVQVFGYPVPMSDLEKTALDCIEYPERAGSLAEASAILAKAARRWDWDKAADYFERRGNTALIQKFGYLCDAGHLPTPEAIRARLHNRLKSSSRTYLVPRRHSDLYQNYDREWGVVVNIDPHTLFQA